MKQIYELIRKILLIFVWYVKKKMYLCGLNMAYLHIIKYACAEKNREVNGCTEGLTQRLTRDYTMD
jgi:hypothetical protein